ncbi:hypothetical protein H113_05964 [Trichophyton rubrum MR1459]|nr:hypothetical protein H113_05964 [Trichophyton rubrum MR1459]
MATYTVQQGDYMWKIANDHGIALDALIAANPQVADPAVIQVGQVLNLPGAAGGTPAAAGDAAAAAASAPPPPAASAEPAEASRGVVNVASAVPPFQGGRQGLRTVGYFTNWVSLFSVSVFSFAWLICALTLLCCVGHLRTQLSACGYPSKPPHPHSLLLCECASRDRRSLSLRHLLRPRETLPRRFLE